MACTSLVTHDASSHHIVGPTAMVQSCLWWPQSCNLGPRLFPCPKIAHEAVVFKSTFLEDACVPSVRVWWPNRRFGNPVLQLAVKSKPVAMVRCRHGRARAFSRAHLRPTSSRTRLCIPPRGFVEEVILKPITSAGKVLPSESCSNE